MDKLAFLFTKDGFRIDAVRCVDVVIAKHPETMLKNADKPSTRILTDVAMDELFSV